MDTRPYIGQVMITVLALALVYSDPASAQSSRPLDPQFILQQAGQAADTAENSGIKIELLIKLSQAYADSGDSTESKAIISRAAANARAMKDRNITMEVIKQLPPGLTIPEGLKIPDRIENPRASFLTQVAQAQIRAGDPEGAKMTLEEAIQLQDPARPYDKIEIVQTFMLVGDIDAAVTFAKDIDDGGAKFNALRNLSIMLARSGQYAAALQLTDFTDDKFTKTYITNVVATEQLLAGREAEARKTAVTIEH